MATYIYIYGMQRKKTAYLSMYLASFEFEFDKLNMVFLFLLPDISLAFALVLILIHTRSDLSI